MPRDGSGTYTLPAGNPVISGTIIDVTWANPTMTDIATALTDSLSRTGSGGMLVPFQNADGTVALPGITWANQPNMGFYRPLLDEMRVSVAGVDKARWTSDASNPMDVFVGGMWVAVMNEGGDYNLTGDWNFDASAGSGAVILSGATDLDLSDGGSLFVRDVGGTDWMEMSHDGSNLLAQFVNTSQIRFSDGVGLRLSDSTNADFLTLVHTGSAANITASVNNLNLISSGAGSFVRLSPENIVTFFAEDDGMVTIASETAGDANRKLLQFTDNGLSVRRGHIGFDGSSTLEIENQVHGGLIFITGENAGGTPRTMIEMRPDLDVRIDHPATNDLVFQTLAATAGGVQVNNQDTGGGLERVLTTSDISGGGAGLVFAGYVPSNGVGEIVPSGWSATRVSLGQYDVDHNLGLTDYENLSVTITAISGAFFAGTGFPRLAQIDNTNSDGNTFRVVITTDFAGIDLVDAEFFFHAQAIS